MPLDPQLAELLARAEQSPPLSSGTPQEARDLFRQLSLLAASTHEPPKIAGSEDIDVDGADGRLRARVYRPRADGGRPTIAYFHGGGFTIGDLDSYDSACRTMCAEISAVLVSVAYRLAPEDPFPAAPRDAIAATRWVAANAKELGGDLARVAVAGDSAGGNLAAVAAQHLRDSDTRLAAQLLLYPAVDLLSDRPSHLENGRGYFLTEDDIAWFNSNYLAHPGDGEDPIASPLRARDLSGLPSAVVATAQLDPLRDDGDAYAQALERAGATVIHHCFGDLVHGFLTLEAFSAKAREATRRVCADLRALLRC